MSFKLHYGWSQKYSLFEKLSPHMISTKWPARYAIKHCVLTCTAMELSSGHFCMTVRLRSSHLYAHLYNCTFCPHFILILCACIFSSLALKRIPSEVIFRMTLCYENSYYSWWYCYYLRHFTDRNCSVIWMNWQCKSVGILPGECGTI